MMLPPCAEPEKPIPHRVRKDTNDDHTLIVIGQEIFLCSSSGRWPDSMSLGSSCEFSLFGGGSVVGRLIYLGGNEGCQTTPRHVALRIDHRRVKADTFSILVNSPYCRKVSRDPLFRYMVD